MSKIAVVTGASSGIGAYYAECLASRGLDLLIVARRRDRLEALATAISGKFGVSVEIAEVDLSDPTETRAFADRLASLDQVDFLVNSAGFGTNAAFVEIEPARIEQELYVDLVALALLTRAVLPRMIARGHGAIVNIASVGGLNPAPYFAPYSGAKAAVIALTQAIYRELKGSGVKVQVLCPGPVPTEFNQVADVGEMPVPNILVQSIEDCVQGSLDDLDRNKAVSIPHTFCRIIFKSISHLPLSWQLALLSQGTHKARAAA